MNVGDGGCQKEICTFDGVAPVCIRDRQVFDLGYEVAEEVSGGKGEIRVLEVAQGHQGFLMFLELIHRDFQAKRKFNLSEAKGVERFSGRV